jgi:hypothetical protein
VVREAAQAVPDGWCWRVHEKLTNKPTQIPLSFKYVIT